MIKKLGPAAVIHMGKQVTHTEFIIIPYTDSLYHNKAKQFTVNCAHSQGANCQKNGAGSPSGLARSLYKCAALWRAVYDPAATERCLRTIRGKKGIYSRFQVSISSRYELAC